MRATFLVPSSRRPVGGIIALYEFANALGRRGHDVHIVHGPGLPDPIRSIEEISWIRFGEQVTHQLCADLDRVLLPDADVIAVTGAAFFSDGSLLRALETGVSNPFGCPFMFVQAYRHLPPAAEARAFGGPWPKACVATWMIDALIADGVPAEQLTYLPYGLDHEVFRATAPVRGRPPRLAMLYNDHPNKNVPTGIAAIELVMRHRPELDVVLFGTTEPLVAVPEAVTFVRSPERRVLVDGIYNASEIFLSPSAREGFGFCAIESMACGCALVTTDNGGSRDYATDGHTALVVPPGDAEAMADAILRLMDDDELRVRIAEAGIEMARRYNWEVSGALLEEWLETLRGTRAVS